MLEIILLYKSNTGFTEKYAEWIQEELNCTISPLRKANVYEITEYDIIIFGGGMHANRINGIKFIKDNFEKITI